MRSAGTHPQPWAAEGPWAGSRDGGPPVDVPPPGSEAGARADDGYDSWGYYGQDYDDWGAEAWPAQAPEGAPGWWPPATGGPETVQADLVGSGPPDVPGPMEAYHAGTRRRRTRRLITACLLVAVVGAAVALLGTRHVIGGGGSPAASPTSGNHASGHGTPGTGSTSLTGPSHLSAAQVFPGGRVTAHGLTFTMVTSQVVAPCAPAAHGTFAAALNSAGCQRVVRATFTDSSRKYAVTSGVAVLPSPASARQVDLRKQFGPDIWFTGLNGAASTSTARITRSGGYGYDVVDGRYIIFAFATFSDGLSPTSPHADVPLLASLSKAFTDSAQQAIPAGEW